MLYEVITLFNLGHDPLDSIPLTSPCAVAGSEILTPEGTWTEVAYSTGCLQTSLLPDGSVSVRFRLPPDDEFEADFTVTVVV